MNKGELIDAVSKLTLHSKTQTGEMFDAFMAVLQNALTSGDNVQMIGFGTFVVEERAARVGRNPATGISVVQPERARRINALMLTCGHYDGSGEFAYRVGLPGKSGVGGGILAVMPGVAAIAAFSPPLDSVGNSVRGQAMVADVAKALGWNLYRVPGA